MPNNSAKRFRNSKIGDFIRWKMELKKIRKFSLNYFFSVLGSREYVKFIILTRSRTGSNLLIDYLNSHGKIFARSEIFRHLKGRDWRAILRTVYRKHPFFTKATGFKIFYGHPFDAPDCDIWKALEQDRAIRVIHLVRSNVLRSIVSHRIADKTNFWFQKRKQKRSKFSVEEKRIHLDFKELVKEFERTASWRLEADARFMGHEILEISYEELTGDPGTTFAKVCEFLGVNHCNPVSSFRKQNPEKLKDLIENYAELKESFKDSRWQEYFVEE
jgi:LPS sulfotransferase NodH